ncbi:hypothetical protein HKX48_002709 [Thoreauomyces humboldtii]|nr:hypothetical protein HKX48_002709 [Thoreauomyces humboldtii]
MHIVGELKGFYSRLLSFYDEPDREMPQELKGDTCQFIICTKKMDPRLNPHASSIAADLKAFIVHDLGFPAVYANVCDLMDTSVLIKIDVRKASGASMSDAGWSRLLSM